MGWDGGDGGRVSREACTIRARGPGRSCPSSTLHCPTSRRSFTGTVVSLGTSGSHSSEPTLLRGQVGAAQGCQHKLSLLSSILACRSCPLPLPQSPAGARLGSALGLLPQDGQRCQVPAKSLELPAASPGRWLERQRQRCLPGLVSFVKAPAAGMSQDLLSPSERRRKGLCVRVPGPGCAGSSSICAAIASRAEL